MVPSTGGIDFGSYRAGGSAVYRNDELARHFQRQTQHLRMKQVGARSHVYDGIAAAVVVVGCGGRNGLWLRVYVRSTRVNDGIVRGRIRA